MRVTVTEVSHEDLVCLVEAMVHGAYYWAEDFFVQKDSDYSEAKQDLIDEGFDSDPCYEDIIARLLINGKKMTIVDIEDDKKFTFGIEEIKNGLNKGIENYGVSLDNSDWDAVTGDHILQLTIFDDLIYG